MTKAIRWDIPTDEAHLICQIVERAIKLREQVKKQVENIGRYKANLAMDLTVCHLNACPLRLLDLLEASDSDFSHDVFGIRKYLDRETGELLDHFLPRLHR